MLTAEELKAAWLVACEMFLDIEMAEPAIVDLSIFPPGIKFVAGPDGKGNLLYFPILVQGRFRLAYNDVSNNLYLGII